MNNTDIFKSLNIEELEDPRKRILDFIFNNHIEEIDDTELRTVAITTRQSFEILFEKIYKIVDKERNKPIDVFNPLNNQSA